METAVYKKNNYGNWVSLKIILTVLCTSLLFLLLWVVANRLHFTSPILHLTVESLKIIFLVGLIFFAFWLFYFLIARWMFSNNGGKVQEKIIGLLLEHIQYPEISTILDIGCGNGYLSILLAQKYPGAKLTAIDYWKGLWGYSEEQSEKNAENEGVLSQITFKQASASDLPFEDETFDLVVSNLVFHEVSDVSDKKDVIKEALRVVKKGGFFVFQDLFLAKMIYGDMDSLMNSMKSCGIKEVHYIDTSKSKFIPFWLRLPFMVGTIALIYGVK